MNCDEMERDAERESESACEQSVVCAKARSTHTHTVAATTSDHFSIVEGKLTCKSSSFVTIISFLAINHIIAHPYTEY